MTHVIVIGASFVVGFVGASQPTVSDAPVAKMPPMASRRLICLAGDFVGCICVSLLVAGQERFVHDQSMNVEEFRGRLGSCCPSAAASCRSHWRSERVI